MTVWSIVLGGCVGGILGFLYLYVRRVLAEKHVAAQCDAWTVETLRSLRWAAPGTQLAVEPEHVAFATCAKRIGLVTTVTIQDSVWVRLTDYGRRVARRLP